MVIIFIILLSAEVQGIYDILFSEPYSVLAIVANLFWNTTNLIVVAYGIKVVNEKPEKREYQRINVDDYLQLRDNKHHNIQVHTENISRSGVSISSEELKNIADNDINIKIDGEENEAQIIGCQETKGQYVCKSKFKKPFILYRLSRVYIQRLVKFVKFTYKNPDKWDDYFGQRKK